MNTALKYGLIAAAAGLGIYSIVKSNKEEEENQAQLQQMQLALQQAKTNLEPELSYGEVRVIRQEKTIEYWRLPAPPAIEGKTLINWYAETTGDQAFAVVPYRVNDNFGAIVMRNADAVPVSIRLKIIGVYA